MPPSRRRPVPSTPTGRPRVAGLRKRPAPAPADPETTRAEQAGAVEDEQVEPVRSARVPGLIERGSDDLHDDDLHDDLPQDDERDLPAPSPRPRPTGRRKRTGEAVAPGVLDDEPRGSDRADRADRDPASADEPARSGLVLPIALVVLAALLVGLGAWFQSRAGDVRYDKALVDSAGTTEVAGQTREAVEKAFSYNFADVASTEKAANELLVGRAKCQYNAIFGPVRALAPEQKLVVTVKAVSSGVTSLDGDRATVLLFLDQVTTRTTDNQSGGGIAMMRVGAVRADGRWKVDNMEMFGQNGEQAAETAKC